MRERKFGVYLSPSGKLKVLEPHAQHAHLMVLDEGARKRHPFPIFGMVHYVKEMSRGWPVFESRHDLKDHEFLGEL